VTGAGTARGAAGGAGGAGAAGAAGRAGARREHRAARAPPAPPAAPELGASIGRRGVNPLDFIKRPVPLLSSEKRDAPKRALGALEAAAAQDETCIWQRVRAMPDPSHAPKR